MKAIPLFCLGCLFCTTSVFSQNWDQTQKITPSERATLDNFGNSVSVDGDYMLIGEPEDDEDNNGSNFLMNSGSAYVFEKNSGGQWPETKKLVATDRAEFDFFGQSVAIRGNTAIVGAPRQDTDANGSNYVDRAGAAYIFDRNQNGTWTDGQKLVAIDRDEQIYFGNAVALDGERLVVGAFRHRPQGEPLGSNYGAAYVFEKNSNGRWEAIEKLEAPDASAGDLFGFAVAISGDFVLIGAHPESEDENGNNTLNHAGSAYVFQRTSNQNWTFAQKLVPSDRHASDNFGYSLALKDERALIAAYMQDFDETGNNNITDAGAAYLFERNGNGTWVETQKIVAPDRGVDDQFGNSVALGTSHLVVGASFEDEDPDGNNTIPLAGSAYIFEKNGNGIWQNIQKIVASDRDEEDNFGTSVSISGNTVCVGAAFDEDDATGNNPLEAAGSAYIFSDENLGIDTSDAMGAVRLYPNPAHSTITLHFPENLPFVNLTQWTLDGRKIASQLFEDSNKVEFTLRGTPGLYLITAETEATTSSFRVIKN